MKLRYEATLDEIVDTHLRLQRRSKLARRWLWQATLVTGLAAAVLLYILAPAITGSKLSWAATGFVIGSGVFFLYYPFAVRRRTRRYIQEQVGNKDPVPFELELTPDGIWTKQQKVQLSFDWADVDEISDLPGLIEMYVPQGGIVVVRDRAFATPAERQRFLELARGYQQRAQASS